MASVTWEGVRAVWGMLTRPSARHLAVLLFAGLLAFDPSSVLEPLGVEAWSSRLRPWAGGIFLLLSCLFAAYAIEDVWRAGCRKLASHRRRKRLEERLLDLTPEEKCTLSLFVFKRTQGHELATSHGAIHTLESEMVITKTLNVGRWEMDRATGKRVYYADYTIDPWVFRHLTENGELLE